MAATSTAGVGERSVGLQYVVYNSTTHAGSVLANMSAVPSGTGSPLLACNCSAVFLGTLTVPTTSLQATTAPATAPATEVLRRSVSSASTPSAARKVTKVNSVRFEASVDGNATLRVWVADFLVLVADPILTRPRYNVSSKTVLPARIMQPGALVRIHHTRTCAPGIPPEQLTLRWQLLGDSEAELPATTTAEAQNTTAAVESAASTAVDIPASALAPVLTSSQWAREAMRERLYAPRVPWQTYAHSSMTAHALQPTGAVLRFALMDVGTRTKVVSTRSSSSSSSAADIDGKSRKINNNNTGLTGPARPPPPALLPAVLGDRGRIAPWPRFVPAHVLPGRHSLNGSDYTKIEIRAWAHAAVAATQSTPTSSSSSSTTPSSSSPPRRRAASLPSLVRRDARFVIETTTLAADGGTCGGDSVTNGDRKSVNISSRSGGLRSGVSSQDNKLRCDLLVAATCTGVDCARMVLVVAGSFEWGSAGHISLVSPALTPTTTTTETVRGPQGGRRRGSAKESSAALKVVPAGEFAPVTVHRARNSAAPPALMPNSTTIRQQLPPGPHLFIGFGCGESTPYNNSTFGTRITQKGSGVCVAAASTGPAPRTVGEIRAAIAAARVRAENALPLQLVNASAADRALAHALFDVLAWNTLFTRALHVYTPVTRNWGGTGPDLDESAVTFVWDVFFAAVMLGLAGPTGPVSQRARDIAYANVITTVFSRTVTGMVPNYRVGESLFTATYDRTEPMVGSWCLHILHSVYGDDWVPRLLFGPLVNWNDWVHARRRGVGMLAQDQPDNRSALISLGSDATVPPGLNTPHTLAAARYESGLDNSPQYDGNDTDAHEHFGTGPVRFDSAASLMTLYDVAFTTYHALDTEALLELAGPARAASTPNGIATVARLRGRLNATATALHADLFDTDSAQYANRLYNGTFYRRWAPTIFAPMLLNSTPAMRIDKMLDKMADPHSFCVPPSGTTKPNATPTDGASTRNYYSTENTTTTGGTAMLWRMQAAAGGFRTSGQSETCASAACLKRTVLDVADFAAIEAVVDTLRTPTAGLALRVFVSSSDNDGIVKNGSGDATGKDTCLATTSNRPKGFVPLNASAPAEAWCAEAPSALHQQPLVLWYSAVLGDHRTCGSGCGSDANMTRQGYARVATLCYARTAGGTNVGQLPCRYGLPSIARSDTAFWDQTYWRGRIWAPQYFLVYAGLRRQSLTTEWSGVVGRESKPGTSAARIQAARTTLASQARGIFTQQMDLFGQVNENTNGVLGVGSDSVRADSYYHWGALHALVALAEAGAYPSPLLSGN